MKQYTYIEVSPPCVVFQVVEMLTLIGGLRCVGFINFELLLVSGVGD
jgi:hypothetical protein